MSEDQLGAVGMSGVERENSKSILKHIIERKQNELEGLRVLQSELPDILSPGSDEALWRILCQYR